MKELELTKKIVIIERKLEGESFDQISNELRISKSTAFKVWNEFESGKAFYIANKDAYLLSKELTDIAKTMKEKGITASDFFEVYALWELLHRLKLNFSSAIEYLNILENVSDSETIVLSIIGIFQRIEKMHVDPKEIVDFMIDNLERQGELKARMEKERKKFRKMVAEKKKISHGVNTLKMKMRDYKNELELVRYIRRRFGGNTYDINNMLKNIGRNGFKLEMLPDLLNIRDIMQRQNIREKDLEEIVLNIKALIKQGITPEGIKRMGKNLGDSSVSDAYESIVYWLSHKEEIVQELKDLKNEKEDLILRKLIAIYLSGFNTIRISAEFLSDDIKNAIKKFTTLSLGVEIIEETNKYVLIQDLSRFSDFLMEKMLQRLYIMTENMVNDTKNLILNFDKTLALDIIDRDMQIDRVFWLISKQFYMALKNNNILKDQGIDITRAFNLRSIAKLFERIGDHSVSISYVALENKIINGNELLPYFDETIEIFRNSYKSYKNLDVESANSEIEKSHIFSKKARELLKNLERKKIKDIVGISSIVESLIRIAMYSADLAEITIDEKMSNF